MIEIRDLKFSYSYGAPFSVPDLKIKEGGITTIIGKNGSGKSTLLKAVTGQLPYKGSIRINERELRALKPMERAREIAYLPQILKSVNMDVQTLAEHGRYPYHGNLRRMSETDLEIIRYALEITGMTEYKDRSLTELSGGERQRAYLSMVIAQNTKFILLDEPTTFMDVFYQKSFWEIIQKLRASGCGILLSAHNLEQSFACSDLICLMEDRRIIKTGKPEEIAEDEESLRRVFGVTLKKTQDRDLLYPYVIRRP